MRALTQLLIGLTAVTSQSPSSMAAIDQPTQAILEQMTGCFDVTYRYAEGAGHDWVFLAQRERIVDMSEQTLIKLQHYRLSNGSLVKHWREEWSQNDGAWTQSVLGPDDSLQYACTSRLQKNQWHCAVPAAPKPFRDSRRTDYQTLDRDSVLQILPTGFVQSERNEKRGSTGDLVTTEVGWNEYRRVADDQCPVVLTDH